MIRHVLSDIRSTEAGEHLTSFPVKDVVLEERQPAIDKMVSEGMCSFGVGDMWVGSSGLVSNKSCQWSS